MTTRQAKKKGLRTALLVVAIILLLIGILIGGWLIARARALSQRPVIEILSPAPNASLAAGSVTEVQVIATKGGSPIEIIEFYADGMLAGRWREGGERVAGLWQWTPRGEGPVNLLFIATDSKGVMNAAYLDVSVMPWADADGDGTPDDQDGCRDDAGPLTNAGCPMADDADNDGIADAEDTCPAEPGLPSDLGCPAITVPDGDGDGRPDHSDRCPDEVGLAEWEGCPIGAWVRDADGDGVPDFMDACPDAYGIITEDGCPLIAPDDADGDGTLDSADACVEEPGPPASDGCPVTGDSDGDGIPDGDDSCPDEPGLPAGDGCAEPGLLADVDLDGVFDHLDRLPDLPGLLRAFGLPAPGDADSDGIADEDDNCPDMAGPAANGGCPYLPLPYAIEDVTAALIPSLGSLLPADPTPAPAEPEPGRGGGPYPHDRDGDGFADGSDACPDIAGPSSGSGCPLPGDRDGDSITDAEDTCPDEYGIVSLGGCQSPDKNYMVSLSVAGISTDPEIIAVSCYIGSLYGDDRLTVRLPFLGDLPLDFPTYLVSSVGEEGALGSILDLRGYADRDLSFFRAMTETIRLNIECWGHTDDIATHSRHLGAIIRDHGFADWHGVRRYAFAEGRDGTLEVRYEITSRPWSH